MSPQPAIRSYASLRRLAQKLRDGLGGAAILLLFAYNRTGKTRLSMEFKEAGKRRNDGNADTLYFNAFTEDLFSWENDLTDDRERHLKLNPDSKFFEALYHQALNLLSHGKYAIHEPMLMGQDNQELFRQILHDFVTRFEFALPEILGGVGDSP